MRKQIGAVGLATLVLGSLFTASAKAALLAEGHLSKNQRSIAWSGGPFFVPQPDPCVDDEAVPCDPSAPLPREHFTVTVDAPAGWHVFATITTENITIENYNLGAFASDGTLLARSNSRWGYESVEFIHQPVPGSDVATYDLRVSAPIVLPGSTYDGTVTIAKPPKVKTPRWEPHGVGACPSGEEALVEALTTPDDDHEVVIDVLVLLDGVDEEQAREIFERTASAYAPLNISLRTDFHEVSFIASDVFEFLRVAREYMRGGPPRGFDIVHTLTSDSMGLAEGVASCLGGAAGGDTAFSASRTHPQEDVSITPLGIRTYIDSSAGFVAHEIGHLYGGKHNYANCVEGKVEDLASERTFNPCTTMWFESTPLSLGFSTINGLIIRQMALRYAD